MAIEILEKIVLAGNSNSFLSCKNTTLLFFRGWFLLFTLSVAINCSITIFFACYCIHSEGWKLLYVIGLIEALIFCGLGWLLSGFTVSISIICYQNFNTSPLRNSIFQPSEAPLSLILQNWKKLLFFHDCIPKGLTNFECVIINFHNLNYHNERV